MPAKRAAALLAPEASALLSLAQKLSPEPCYLVGGSLRDALLGRPFHDLDIAAPKAKALAQALAASEDGAFVALDEDWPIYRVVLRKPRGALSQIDVAGLQGKSIAEDLARRDFTINALALPAAGGEIIDPRGGRADLAKRLVRAESESLFRDDPLRLLRAARIAAQLGFDIEGETLKMMGRLRQRVRYPAAERVQAEVMALLAVPGCAERLAQLDGIGLLTALFPELEPARACAVSYYGEGGVMRHSLDTVRRADFLLRNLGKAFPEQAPAIEKHLGRRAGHKAVLLLAALLHDVAKAETAKMVDGRLRFFGHDLRGARRAAQIMDKLRFPKAQVQAVSTIVAQHLRPGHLASGGPVTEKAAYRFFRDLGEEAAGLLLVCWADHASYLDEPRLLKLLRPARLEPGEGMKPVAEDARKTVLHLQIVSLLMRKLFSPSAPPVPKTLLDGHAVMRAAGCPPGPRVGELLELLREAQAEGKVKTRQEALAFLKKS